MTLGAYPTTDRERTRWILARRTRRNPVDAQRPYAFILERERNKQGEIATTATIFLTNRECPWHCVMCDLWRNTSDRPVKPGDIPAQIEWALAQMPAAENVKLYNSGSFFDQGAIPKSDWPAIASLLRPFRHVIVECHPALIGPRILDFIELLPGTLEVAMGLESGNPEVLKALNKRITLGDFQRASLFLKKHRIDLRTFLLVHPPFQANNKRAEWLERSVAFAFNSGSDVVSLIPLRSGNGALDSLIAAGTAAEPTLSEVENAQAIALRHNSGRVFTDTWDLQRLSTCACASDRARRIERINLSQTLEPTVPCSLCG